VKIKQFFKETWIWMVLISSFFTTLLPIVIRGQWLEIRVLYKFLGFGGLRYYFTLSSDERYDILSRHIKK